MITSTKQSVPDKRYLYTMNYYEKLNHLRKNFSILIKGRNTVKAFDHDPYTWHVILRTPILSCQGQAIVQSKFQ